MVDREARDVVYGETTIIITTTEDVSTDVGPSRAIARVARVACARLVGMCIDDDSVSQGNEVVGQFVDVRLDSANVGVEEVGYWRAKERGARVRERERGREREGEGEGGRGSVSVESERWESERAHVVGRVQYQPNRMRRRGETGFFSFSDIVLGLFYG